MNIIIFLMIAGNVIKYENIYYLGYTNVYIYIYFFSVRVAPIQYDKTKKQF